MTTATLPTTSSARAVEAAPRRGRRFDIVPSGSACGRCVVYVFLFLPIGFVVVHSFTDSRDFTRWGGFTTSWYSRLLDNHGLQRLADELVQGRRRRHADRRGARRAGRDRARPPAGRQWTKAFLALVFLILVTPEIVDAIGLQIWFVRTRRALPRGFLFPSSWFGQSIFSSAVVTLIVRARMAGPRRIPRGGGRRPVRNARHARSARSRCR